MASNNEMGIEREKMFGSEYQNLAISSLHKLLHYERVWDWEHCLFTT